MSQENVEIIQLSNWYLSKDNTLKYYDLDGGGKTSFLITINDNKSVLVSFKWSVGLNKFPKLDKYILLFDNITSESKIENLKFDFNSLNGEIYLNNKLIKINHSIQLIKKINVWSNNTRTYDYTLFDKTIGKLKLTIDKPQ